MKINEIKNAVVVPWDFSEMSLQALEAAVNAVDPTLIRVVHVTEYPTAYEYGVVWDMVSEDLIVNRLTAEFEKEVRQRKQLEGLSLSVLFGNPAQQICQFADELAADLIWMPSHGRSGFPRFLLGSVAERVLRGAPCPVLILRQTADAGVDAGISVAAAVGAEI